MEKTHRLLAAALLCAALATTACSSDGDKYSLDYFYETYTSTAVLPDTLSMAIAWDGTTATVSGEQSDSVTVTVSNGDVTIASTTQRFLEITATGTANDGSLLVFSEKKWGLILDGLTLTNADGPAINNQCGKWLYVTLADGTTNTLTDGTTYATAPTDASGNAIDQKGTLFSEGQMYFTGTGSLTVNGNARNGIASDDYIIFSDGAITVNMSATASNGIKVNDGLEILGGTLDIAVLADGARGIKDDAYMTISGGTTTVTTEGKPKIETVDGVADTTSCAGIKCDSTFTITAGQLTITSKGDGGKGINATDSVKVEGGTLTVTTEGGNTLAKPKGVKSDKAIVISGGSFTVTVAKSWACDNGTDSDDPTARLTIEGEPTSYSILKKSVKVIF